MSFKKQSRQSNIEAARILSMSLITIWHFNIHGMGGGNYLSFRYLIPFINYGVDLFILISGYFLIRLKPKVIIQLAIVVITFEVFSLICAKFFYGDINVLEFTKNIIDPLGNSQYWFITYYIALVLLSPVLNKSLETTDIRLLRRFIILLSVFNAVSCWLFSSKLDQGGYSLFNFIYLYCIGQYVHRDNLSAKLTKLRILSIFIIATIVNLVIVACLIFKNQDADFESLAFSLAGKYSNPFTIVCAVSILLIFLKYDFNSKTINVFASCSLGVYLLQDGALGKYIYQYQVEVAADGNLTDYLLLCATLFVGFWFSSFILMRPIKKLSNLTTQCFGIMANRLYSFTDQ